MRGPEIIAAFERYHQAGFRWSDGASLQILRISDQGGTDVPAWYDPEDGSVNLAWPALTRPPGAWRRECAWREGAPWTYVLMHEIGHAADFALHPAGRPWSAFAPDHGSLHEVVVAAEHERESWSRIWLGAIARRARTAREESWGRTCGTIGPDGPVALDVDATRALRGTAWAASVRTAGDDESRAVRDRRLERSPTAYGRKSSLEDFAECLVLHLVAPEELARRAPERSAYLRRALPSSTRSHARV